MFKNRGECYVILGEPRLLRFRENGEKQCLQVCFIFVFIRRWYLNSIVAKYSLEGSIDLDVANRFFRCLAWTSGCQTQQNLRFEMLEANLKEKCKFSSLH